MSHPTRRDFMLMAAGAAVVPLAPPSSNAPAQSAPTPAGRIQVWVTDGERRHAPAAPLPWEPARGAPGPAAITIEPAAKAQPILGFGAAFTDAACYNIARLPPAAKEALLRELFGASGLGLSVCRCCVGSSDYARFPYSFDEGAPDPSLSRFSIDHDRAYILPVMRRARAINPSLFLLASPWSPPGWMKDNNSMLGGTIRRHLLPVYAQYMAKFLAAYRAEGVAIQAVTPQNEVDTDQDSLMPACLFPQEVEVGYVAGHLGPALAAAGLDTRIWLIDHNYNLWGRAICELDDAGVARYAKAVAWHGYVGEPAWMRRVAAAHPEVEMYWTEGGPDIADPNYALDWMNWGRTAIGVLRNGARCLIGWNLALDERGKPNIGPFSCGGLVTVHSQTGALARSGQYWAWAHFSRALPRGSVVVGSHGGPAGVEHVAARLPGGGHALIVANAGAAGTIEIHHGEAVASLDVPANGLVTLRY